MWVALAVLCLACVSVAHRHLARDSVACRAPATFRIVGRVDVPAPHGGGYAVRLYTTNGTAVSSSVVSSAADGSFSVDVSLPRLDALVFAIATRGAHEMLVSVLHKARVAGAPHILVVNANTTVAAAYTLAQFVASGGQDAPVAVYGPATATRNAGMLAALLVDSRTGVPSPALRTAPNNRTLTGAKLHHLAALVGACNANYASLQCVQLRAVTARAGAFVALARLATLPSLPLDSGVMIPAPRDWTLPVVLTDTGSARDGFSGPGALAFDAEGNMYITNNYQFGSGAQCVNGTEPCPSPYIVILAPDGSPLPQSPFRGAGNILGPGFGVSINRATGDLWVGSFVDLSVAAFTGRGAPDAGFVSQFSAASLAFVRRIQSNDTAGVQGVTSDRAGNVFFNALTTNSTFRVDAVTGAVTRVQHERLRNPFDIDTDSQGNVWVSDSNPFTFPSYAVKMSNNLTVLLTLPLPPPVRIIVADPPFIGTFAKGIVVDRWDNVWVSAYLAQAVAAYTADGVPLPGSPYALPGAGWGLSLDGRGNVYVAGFGAPETLQGHFVLVLCGAASAECAPGQVLSRADGWARGENALERVTDVQVAASGAVIALNNWKTQPTPSTDPGGNGVVVFPGLGVPPGPIVVLG